MEGEGKTTQGCTDMTWASMLLNNLEVLRQQGLRCDTTVSTSTSGCTFRAHSTVLTAASPILSNAFSGVSVNSAIELPLEFSASAVDAFLTFIYTGVVKCQNDALLEIKQLSESLEVFALTEICTEAIATLPAVADPLVVPPSQTTDQSGPDISEAETVEVPVVSQTFEKVIKTEPEDNDFAFGGDLKILPASASGETTEQGNQLTENALVAPSCSENRNQPRRSRRYEKNKKSNKLFAETDQLPSHPAITRTQNNKTEKKPGKPSRTKRTAKLGYKENDIKLADIDGNQTKENIGSSVRVNLKKTAAKSKDKTSKQCSYCGKVFAILQMLRYHEMQHRGESRFSCEFCGKGYVAKHNFEAHVRKHTGERPFQCESCLKSFRDKNSLKVHRKYHCKKNEASRPVCEDCKVQFWSQTCLEEHRSKCLGTPTADSEDGNGREAEIRKSFHTCEVCHADFPRYNVLKLHMKTHTEIYSCNFCVKSFRWEHSLRQHLEQHVGKKSHTCSHCKKAFWTKFELKTHERVHTGDRPYPCNFCSKSFKTSSQRSLHHKAHAGVKTHACEICHKKFLGGNKLKRHMMTHLTASVFVCPTCKKTFKLISALKEHMESHTINQVVETVMEGSQDNDIPQQTFYALPVLEVNS